MKLVILYGCPDREDIAPYHKLVLDRAGQRPAAIYRGEDAEPMLNKLGKHSQRQLVHATPSERVAWGIRGTPNPENRSQHELRSDGHADGGPPGRKLPTYRMGVDSGGDDQRSKDQITEAARHFGLSVEHPYSSGVEGHHWCFTVRPHFRRFSTNWWRVVRLRRQLRKDTKRLGFA